MTKYLDLYRIILKTFGFQLRPLGTFALIQMLHASGIISRSLDNVFSSGYRKTLINKPVFILGNPRSGTTFVHRFLLNTDHLCSYELWEMMFPAVSTRKITGKVVNRLTPVSPVRYHSSDAHETSLRDVETDDAMAFFRFIDGGFLWVYFLAWDDHWGSEKCRSCFYPQPRRQKRIFDYLEGCWKRNMYVKKQDRILVKSSIFSLHVETLLKRYPDCKIIYVVRDPLESIPSGMSLITGVLERRFDILNSVDKKNRSLFLENLYQVSCHFYKAFKKTKDSGLIPQDNLRIVTYPALIQNLEDVMKDLIEFIEIETDSRFWEKVRDEAAKQRTYHSQHRYSLDKFDLNEERIREDLSSVYSEYDI